VCESQRERLYSVTEQNANDLGVFDVETMDRTPAVCTGCVLECVCVNERVCMHE